MVDSGELKKIIQKVKDSSNVLVTVSSSPSVDQLSAALAITLCMNKLNKHATAVFSGDVPPAIEFLNPEKTFENTVDSLRDFIIALDKEKADHLRYKVVDDMVKIFITPYRTVINENDLNFSQGDYNVELVLAIGVQNESDLDRALESHGRILHDATVVSISTGEPTKLGGIEWADNGASSYSEMLFQIADGLKGEKNLVDEQIANAFLTGIVAATDRFSNDKTSSRAMTTAAQLMSAGANQQLIATKLEEGQTISSPNTSDIPPKNDTPPEDIPQDLPKEKAPKQDDGDVGALSISHMPEGTLDEVTEEVATEKSNQALNHVEEQLAKHTEKVNSDNQEDATELAEQKLAEQLAPVVSVPPVIAAELPKVQPQQPYDVKPSEPKEAADTNTWKARSGREMSEPTLGGTLNATTEQAEEDKQRQIDDDRNRTILSHNGSTYASNVPSFQSPINASMGTLDAEPEVRDVLAEGSASATTSHAESIQPLAEAIEAIQPPVPVPAEPTLAEIDAQHRVEHNDALAAVDAALGAVPVEPSSSIGGNSSSSSSLPPLPPLPPMPDFSTLPPLPNSMPSSDLSVPDTLGEGFPPATFEQPVTSNDPGQFHIPGQP